MPVTANAIQIEATNPNFSVWLAASAGTGKTKVLTDRVLRLLLTGANIDKILCLTFTKNAATEMQHRLEQKMQYWHSCSESELLQELSAINGSTNQHTLRQAQELYERYLNHEHKLNIMTIHAFCLQLLAKFPGEIGLAPNFKLLDDITAHALQLSALNQCYHDQPQLIGKLLPIISVEAMQQLIPHVAASIDDETMFDIANFAQRLGVNFDTCAYQNNDLTTKFINQLQQQLSRLIQPELIAQLAASSSKTNQSLATKIQQYQLPKVGTWQDLLSITHTKTFTPKARVIAKAIINYDTVQSTMLELQNEFDQLFKNYCHQLTLSLNHSFLTLVKAFKHHYQQLKTQQNVVDYQDLIDNTCQLLTNPDHRAWVSLQLDGIVEHLLVDEAQDTAPKQWQIITLMIDELLANDQHQNKSFFVVGDIKQSIYSFQGADPEYFNAAYQFLCERATHYQHPFKKLSQATSYRSGSAVLNFVDHVFNSSSIKDLGFIAESINHQIHRLNSYSHVELWPLLSATKTASLQPWPLPNAGQYQLSSAQLLARAVAKQIKSWLNQGKTLANGKPVSPGDIMILLKKRGVIQNYLIKELRRHGIGVSGSDRLLLTDHLAIKDVIALLKWTQNPDDDFLLALVLKSPFLGITEEALFTLCYQRDSSLWQQLQDNHHEYVNRLQQWLDWGLTDNPLTFIVKLLTINQGRDLLVARLGSEVHELLDELIGFAYQQQFQHCHSIADFILIIEENAPEIKRDFSQQAEEITILTAHGAKGLQAPIVILPDTTTAKTPYNQVLTDTGEPNLTWLLPESKLCPPYLQELKTKHQQHELEESLRLLYVALTRAEDELYIMGYNDSGEVSSNSWYHLLQQSFSDYAAATTIANPAWLADQVTWHGQAYAYTHLEPPQPVSIAMNNAIEMPIETPIDKPSYLSIKCDDIERLQNKAKPVVTAETVYGVLVHKLLEYLPASPYEINWPQLEQLAEDNELPQLPKAINTIKQLLSNVEIAELIRHPQGQNEVEIITASGKMRIDRLIITDTVVKIIDYKTSATKQQLNEHRHQVNQYREAISSIYPTHTIAGYVIYTDLGEVESVDILDNIRL